MTRTVSCRQHADSAPQIHLPNSVTQRIPSAHQEKRALLDPRSKPDFKAAAAERRSRLPLFLRGARFHLPHGGQQEMCHVVFSICRDRSYVPPRGSCVTCMHLFPAHRMHVELNPAKLQWLFFSFLSTVCCQKRWGKKKNEREASCQIS